MRKIALFCEDTGHEAVINALIHKLIPIPDGAVQVIPLSTRNGKGKALSQLADYLNQVKENIIERPDAIVAAIDANCKGYNDKKREIDDKIPDGFGDITQIIHAIPDPHVERWLLIDSQAFKHVFGKGCSAPDQKCEKDRYKKLLSDAVKQAGGTPLLGGIEYAEDIVDNMDIHNIKRLDESLKKFIEELEDVLKRWKVS
jgi:hypothetical protein